MTNFVIVHLRRQFWVVEMAYGVVLKVWGRTWNDNHGFSTAAGAEAWLRTVRR